MYDAIMVERLDRQYPDFNQPRAARARQAYRDYLRNGLGASAALALSRPLVDG
ncbi:MAG: hypothetical protein QF654_08255 [Alphaproteobacteria bacterium]|jgi:hypothetical protein|nr:hypothetical protein [Alphaproteobacteria bacterium]|tara:strand:- start:146 stop:304 length:159 start_codon:yes stop_codon:yes gene_type:complete